MKLAQHLTLAFIALTSLSAVQADVTISMHHAKRFAAGLGLGPFGLIMRGDKAVMQRIMKYARPEDSKILIAGALTQLALTSVLLYKANNIPLLVGWQLAGILSLTSAATTELLLAWYFGIKIHELNKRQT